MKLFKSKKQNDTKPNLKDLLAVSYECEFPEATALQKRLMNAYRLTSEFRWDYGYEVIRRNPDGERVRGAIRVIKKYLNVNASIITHRKLIADMIYSRNVLGFKYWEYFVYNLEPLTPIERTEFIPQNIRYNYYAKLNNNRKYTKIFDRKNLAYTYLKDYFKREIVTVNGPEDLDAFKNYCHQYKRFIIKPYNGSIGKGVQVLNIEEYTDLDKLFNDLLQQYTSPEKNKLIPFLCEELIVNADSFAALHPESVNSMRIVTYFDGTDSHIVTAWLKAGRGSAVIDNGSSGGVLAAVDIDTGRVTTHARDERNNTFPTHPDTGVTFKGMQIERWDEAVAMTKEMAKIVPQVRIVSWDVALSKDRGWQLIEGNSWGMFNVLQVATQKGMRREFEKRVEWHKYKNN